MFLELKNDPFYPFAYAFIFIFQRDYFWDHLLLITDELSCFSKNQLFSHFIRACLQWLWKNRFLFRVQPFFCLVILFWIVYILLGVFDSENFVCSFDLFLQKFIFSFFIRSILFLFEKLFFESHEVLSKFFNNLIISHDLALMNF